MTVDIIRARVLDGVAHGFLGRGGGESRGVDAGLNVGSGSSDDPALVERNVAQACAAILPGATLTRVYQVHSAEAVVASDWGMDQRPRADAIVTDRPRVLLGIVTADCAPVLLADVAAGVIGAAHAGWRGAIDGVTDAAIAAMVKLGARREAIVAAVGPCIAQASYEVDEAFRARFLGADPINERFFVDKPAGKPHFDLAAYVAGRLTGAGIGRVEVSGLDTCADEERFFSYRRATHRGEGDYGRQFSLIGLRR